MKFKKGDLICYKSNPDICIGSIANESIGLHSKPCYNIHLDDEFCGKFFHGNHPDTYVVAEDMIMLYEPMAEKVSSYNIMSFKKGDLVCYKSNPDICIGSIANDLTFGLSSDDLHYEVFLNDNWVKYFSKNGVCPNTGTIPESLITLYKPMVEKEAPQTEKDTYYVCEMWHCDEGMPFTWNKDKYADVKEFDTKEDALKYINDIVDDNVNIVRCISKVHPREWKKPYCKYDKFKEE